MPHAARQILPLLGGFAAIQLGVGLAVAADIELLQPERVVHGDRICNLRVSGPIKGGDYEQIKRLLPQDEEDSWVDASFTACLDSPGGSFNEGVRIAELFMDRSINTLVEADAECWSACATIFMGGTYATRRDFVILRELHVDGKLGFHAPYMRSSLPVGDQEAVGEIYRAAIDALTRLLQIGNRRSYTGMGPWVSSTLIAEMLTYGPSDVFEIDTIDKAGRWNIRLTGMAPPPQISDANLVNACANAFSWLNEESSIEKSSRVEFSPGLDVWREERFGNREVLVRLEASDARHPAARGCQFRFPEHGSYLYDFQMVEVAIEDYVTGLHVPEHFALHWHFYAGAEPIARLPREIPGQRWQPQLRFMQ